MKRRILAIVLVLMLAVSLLPVSAAADDDDYIYVSVNGTAFTDLNQAVACGDGIAALLYDEETDGFILYLEDATIDKFENVFSQDGITYYAGIVYEGTLPLEICCFGKNVIKAPSHDGSKYYEGILANGDASITEDDEYHYYNHTSLSISGVDCGIDNVNGLVKMSNTTVNVSASDAGIICNELTNARSYLTVDCTGNVGIAANTVNSNKGIVVTLTPDVKKGYSDCFAMTAETYNLTRSGDTGVNRFNVNYDGSAYKGTEPITVCGLAVSTMSRDSNSLTTVEVNVNASCTKNISAIGISAGTCNAYDIKCNLKLKGEHAESAGVFAEELVLPRYMTSTVSGAAATDLAVMAGNLRNTNWWCEFFYVSTDCSKSECGAMFVEDGIPASLFDRYNMFEPKFGGFASLTEDGKSGIVVDADGNPARVLLLRRDVKYPFTDIEGNALAPYKDATIWASEMGITAGTDPITFSPNLTCTREQIVTFLWRAMGCPEPNITENPFTDVMSTGLGAPYYKAILWAYENGITMGTDATHFSPKLVCTRCQVVTFLWRAVGCPEPTSTQNLFTDVSKDSFYFKPVLWAVENDITKGTGRGLFSPNAVCTRCQIVTFIYRDRDEIAKAANSVSAVSAVVKTDAAEHADNRHTLKYFIDSGDKYKFSQPVDLEVSFSDGSTQLYTINFVSQYETVPDDFADVVAVRDGKVCLLIKEEGNVHPGMNPSIGKVLEFDPQLVKMKYLMYADEAWLSDDGNSMLGYYNRGPRTTSATDLLPEKYYETVYVKYDFVSGKSYTKDYKDYCSYLADDAGGVYFSNISTSTSKEDYCLGYYFDFATWSETKLFTVTFNCKMDRAVCLVDETGYTLKYFDKNATDDVLTERHFDFAGNEILPE